MHRIARYLLGAVAALLSATLAGSFARTAVQAGGDGYQHNFGGQIVTLYQQPAGDGVVTVGLPVHPPALQTVFDASWSAKRGTLCDQIHRQVNTSNWRACDVPKGGELRAKLLGPNQIALQYIIAANHVRYDQTTPSVFGSYADPTIDATFDLELDLSLTIGTAIDGDTDLSYPSTLEAPIAPLTRATAQVHILNAHITTANVAAAIINYFTGDISRAENAMNRSAAPLDPNQLAGFVQDTNRQLYGGAAQLGQLLRSQNPGANARFDLDVILGPGTLVFTYRRVANAPAAPTNVQAVQSLPGDPVTLSWSGSAGAGGQFEVDMIDSRFNQWSAVGTTSGLGFAAPPLTFLGPGVTTMYQVCALNAGGRACTNAPGIFQASPPGSDGGDGGDALSPQPGQGGGQPRPGCCRAE